MTDKSGYWWEAIDPQTMNVARDLCQRYLHAEIGKGAPTGLTPETRVTSQLPRTVGTPLGSIWLAEPVDGEPLWTRWIASAAAALNEGKRLAAKMIEEARLPTPADYAGGPLVVADGATAYTLLDREWPRNTGTIDVQIMGGVTNYVIAKE